MEMKYGFTLKDFNEKNFEYAKQSLEKNHVSMRMLITRPESPMKEKRARLLRQHIEMYEWYLAVYPQVIESIDN